MKRLEGKVAIVTGAGAGIGRCAAQAFAAAGARVTLADLDEGAGRLAAEAVRAEHGEAIFVRTDMTEPDSVEECVRETVRTFGKLDTLYNNVGGTHPDDGPADTMPIEVFWATIKRDLFSTFLGCRFAIPEIVKAGGGAVVNTASVHGLLGGERPTHIAYTAAKGGVAAMTRALAVEYGPRNVRVNALAPGLTLTERVSRSGLEEIRQVRPGMMARHQLGPMEPLDIALAALYLASDEARRVTGQILPVDSGWTAS